MKNILIGFDVGTSSLKLVAFNLNTRQTELELTSSTDSARIKNNEKCSLNDEQNVDVLVSLVECMLARIPAEVMSRIKAVQICGQMHGVVLWNTANCRGVHSNLVTWQGNSN